MHVRSCVYGHRSYAPQANSKPLYGHQFKWCFSSAKTDSKCILGMYSKLRNKKRKRLNPNQLSRGLNLETPSKKSSFAF